MCCGVKPHIVNLYATGPRQRADIRISFRLNQLALAGRLRCSAVPMGCLWACFDAVSKTIDANLAGSFARE